MLCGEVVVNVPSRPARRLSRPDQAEGLAALLTCRERQCLLMLVEGLDTAAMVARLGVSRTTVRTHLQAVLTKLGVHSRLEAASFAVRYGLPDAWSGDRLAIAASKMRAIRPPRPAAAGMRRLPRPLPVPVAATAGRGAGSG
jgi:DNA-binding CsgD family transcriptional regulator